MFVEYQLCISELNISHANPIFQDRYYLLNAHVVSDTILGARGTGVNRTKSCIHGLCMLVKGDREE